MRLGDEALRRGEWDLARQRFERAFRAAPGSPEGPAGLARVALARDNPVEARRYLQVALERDPAHTDALVDLARLEAEEGSREAAIALLQRAIQAEPGRPDAHEMLFDLTGLAPRSAAPTGERAVTLADAHPYDPRALYWAAQARLQMGQPAIARELLERAIWLADLDEESAGKALARIGALDPSWKERLVVPVHVFADESVRAHPGWRFRMRILWVAMSHSLDWILGVRFIPVSIQAFSSGQGPGNLDRIDAKFERQIAGDRRKGIFAAFTERPKPSRRVWKMGLARFLGRQLTVRLEPGEVQSRPLAHELLHLYGGIHVVEDVDSLMNPSGESMNLDRGSLGIVQAMRTRRFDTSNIELDVLSRIDVPKAIDAYEAALLVNLAYRRLGLQEARTAARNSRASGARKLRQTQELDPHMADVLIAVSALLRRDGRPAESLPLMEAAAELYGAGTPRQREVRREARQLREHLMRAYGVGGD